LSPLTQPPPCTQITIGRPGCGSPPSTSSVVKYAAAVVSAYATSNIPEASQDVVPLSSSPPSDSPAPDIDPPSSELPPVDAISAPAATEP